MWMGLAKVVQSMEHTLALSLGHPSPQSLSIDGFCVLYHVIQHDQEHQYL